MTAITGHVPFIPRNRPSLPIPLPSLTPVAGFAALGWRLPVYRCSGKLLRVLRRAYRALGTGLARAAR